MTQEEAYATAQSSGDPKHKPTMKGPLPAAGAGPIKEDKDSAKRQSGPAPGPVVPASLKPLRSVKGAPSSLTVSKRKREDNKPKQKTKTVTAEEAAALKAREAARKRVEEREKSLHGLYQSR